VLAARKKLADTTELQSDPELNSNSQFSEMREAIRTTSSNIGVRYQCLLMKNICRVQYLMVANFALTGCHHQACAFLFGASANAG
jgi:hypothetical protein